MWKSETMKRLENGNWKKYKRKFCGWNTCSLHPPVPGSGYDEIVLRQGYEKRKKPLSFSREPFQPVRKRKSLKRGESEKHQLQLHHLQQHLQYQYLMIPNKCLMTPRKYSRLIKTLFSFLHFVGIFGCLSLYTVCSYIGNKLGRNTRM